MRAKTLLRRGAAKEVVESRKVRKGTHITSFKGKRDCLQKNINIISYMTLKGNY